MCGRYGLEGDRGDIERRFGAGTSDLASFVGSGAEIHPGRQILVIRTAGGRREAVAMRWGLPRPGRASPTGLINARGERLLESRLWRPLLERHRVLIPATGFYEWTGPPGARRAIWFDCRGLVAFAGVARDDGAVIITTRANQTVAPIHDRMPVILDRAGEDAWIGDDADLPELTALLVPYTGSLDVSESASRDR